MADGEQEYILDQVEADIRLCEEFLARDSTNPAEHDSDDYEREGRAAESNVTTHTPEQFRRVPQSAWGEQQGEDQLSRSSYSEEEAATATPPKEFGGKAPLSSRKKALSKKRREEILRRLENQRRTVKSSEGTSRRSRAKESTTTPSAAAAMGHELEGHPLRGGFRDDVDNDYYNDEYHSAGEEAQMQSSDREFLSPSEDSSVGRDAVELSGPAEHDVIQNDEEPPLPTQSQTPRLRRAWDTRKKETTYSETNLRRPQSAAIYRGTPGRHSREAAILRAKKESEAELTFKPKLSKTPNSQRNRIKHDNIERLSQPKTEFYKKMSRKKAVLEESKTTECTFRPGIRASDQFEQADQAMSVQDRLFYGTERRYISRQKAKKAMIEAELAECTFRPKISENAQRQSGNYRPIQERIGDLQRRKQEKHARIRLSLEMDKKDLTFHPVVSENSKRIADTLTAELLSETGMTVSDRLANGITYTSNRKKMKEKAIERESKKECTFAPEINPVSELLVEARAATRNVEASRDFVERQSLQSDRRTRRLQKLLQENTRECTFQPKVNDAKEKLKKSVYKARENESMVDKFERLSNKDRERRETNKNEISKNYYADYTFQPVLDKTSLRMARKTPLVELVENQRNKATKEEARARIEQELMKECTFKPRIDSRSKRMQPPPSRQIIFSESETLSERVSAQLSERESALQEARDCSEFEELKQCTFTPQINHNVMRAKAPVVVHGLVRHLETQENAKRQKEEQKRREDKLFYRNMASSYVTYTVPEPFSFDESQSYERAQERKARISKEIVKGEMKECTFKPDTNEAKNKALLNQLLH